MGISHISHTVDKPIIHSVALVPNQAANSSNKELVSKMRHLYCKSLSIQLFTSCYEAIMGYQHGMLEWLHGQDNRIKRRRIDEGSR